MSQQQPSPDTSRGQNLPAGTRLEEFVIEQVMGVGGFGITYLARDSRLGRKVVIKENLPAQFCWRDTHALTVRPRHSEGEDSGNFQYSLESFEREASTLASLDHPGIVRVLRSFEAYGTAYFVMPFVEGTALDEQIRARKTSGQDFTEDELGGMLWRVLDALAYLHDRGIYHRDIKPGNILVTAAGEPVLIDFGAARQRLSDRSLTVIESSGYTPFEQLQTRGKVGPWSDIYALGSTLYKAITGETPAKAADRAFDDPEVPLTERPELQARYSSRLLKSIDKAMAPKAADRFQDAGQWRDNVWKASCQSPPEFVHEAPVATAPPPPPLEPAPLKPDRAKRGEPAASSRTPVHKQDQAQPISPPLPRGKKSSMATLIAVFVIVTAVFGSIGYLLKPSVRAPESPPDGWAPREAPQEEVDRYAAAGVLDAQVEKLARVLGISTEGLNKTDTSAEEMAQAFEQLKALALKGSPRSMNGLGVCNQYGRGVTKNEVEAVKWYRKSAEAGDSRGMYNLGRSYANGEGVPKDETEAAYWYRKAADLDFTPAMNSLGFAFQKGLGVMKNEATAVTWHRKSAEAGNDIGMFNLGLCLIDGTGVQKDETEAVSWYRKAAEAGYDGAMNNLGVCYINGIGVQKDETEAVSWYRKAAEAGNELAMKNLSGCYSKGVGVQKDEAQAAAWLRKAEDAADANTR